MRWRNVAILAVLLVAGTTSAQTARERPTPERNVSDLLLRVNGPVRVAPGDSASTVWVVGNDATIDGTVREQLLVVNGAARVTGVVRGDVTVVNGHLDLAPGARVGGDVLLYRSTLARAPGAQVAGVVHDETGFSFGARAVWLLWLSMTLLVVASGLVFAALAGRQLAESAALVVTDPIGTLVTGAILWAGLPVLAFVSFLTVVGIPLGFAILFVVIPALTWAGYVVAGTALGRIVLRRVRHGAALPAGPGDHPYADAAVGLVLLQLLSLVPGVGGPVVLLAGLVGAGALLYRLWRARPRGAATTGSAAVAGARA